MANNKNDTQKLSFDKQLVLSNFISSQFGYKNINDLFALLKDDYRYDTIDASNHTQYYNELNIIINNKLLLDKIAEYDYNIVSHLEYINKERLIKIKLKYYQYLYLLFVEYYLDMYFNNKDELLAELNDFVDRFYNDDFSYKLSEYKYSEDDLNYIALWSATGSGKTILMHINFLQYKHYSKNKYNKEYSYILITPNERLSYQHIEEFTLSNIESDRFNKMHGLGSDYISVIENTKLAEKEGVEQIAVESLGNDNVVFVDEGHRGTKGDTWFENRKKLCEKGFSFEYSATFGQAVVNNNIIFTRYAKSIIFDYSYKYFYNDGYGKDFNILNHNNTSNITADFIYMVGVLLTFYQQIKFYNDNMAECKKFDISKPLLIFVGNTVTNKGSKNESDIEKVIIFIKEFLENINNKSVIAIRNILKSESGYLNKNNQDIFASSLKYLISKALDAEVIYKDMLEKIFNCSSSQSILHIENIKGSDGEIALKAGENEYFGVINVGDAATLVKSLKGESFSISESSFKDSLFAGINNDKSNINILIGAKKFTEGWNSYRVSCMGLLNVGQSEGSSIIQLFGRGVRLKGYNNSLKRSNAYKKIDLTLKTPEFFNTMETLNIFGINADYMKKFEEFIRREGVEIKEFETYHMNVIRNKSYKNKKLYTIKLKEGLDYKKQADIPLLQHDENINIVLDLFNTVQSISSQEIEGGDVTYDEYHIPKNILPFFNYDNIYFKMQEYKNMTGSYNINITKECIIDLLNCNDKWSVIHAYNDITIINSFEDITRLENTAIMLLKKYFDKFYYKKRLEWESLHQEYVELSDDDNNFIEDDIIDISINKDKQAEYESNIKELIEAVKEAQAKNTPLITSSVALIKYTAFDAMLYYPLLYNYRNLEIKISPVSLNEGEYKFLEDLKKHIDDNKADIQDIYVIRNQSKKGVGFFTGSGFYPDFIMWVIKDNVQYINFIDPHGISRTSIMDSKVEFYNGIKEVEKRLNDNGKYNVVLNSFILSPKSIQVLQKPEPQKDWEDKHVFFMDDKEYIKKIFDEMK